MILVRTVLCHIVRSVRHELGDLQRVLALSMPLHARTQSPRLHRHSVTHLDDFPRRHEKRISYLPRAPVHGEKQADHCIRGHCEGALPPWSYSHLVQPRMSGFGIPLDLWTTVCPLSQFTS